MLILSQGWTDDNLTYARHVSIIGELNNFGDRRIKLENLWLSLFWSGPIGLAIFFAGLGSMIYLLAKANEINKRTKKEYPENK
jgi:hypothetical protein